MGKANRRLTMKPARATASGTRGETASVPDEKFLTWEGSCGKAASRRRGRRGDGRAALRALGDAGYRAAIDGVECETVPGRRAGGVRARDAETCRSGVRRWRAE